MSKRMPRVGVATVIALLLAVLLAACAETPAPSPTPEPADMAARATDTPRPPTATPLVPPTPLPTATPIAVPPPSSADAILQRMLDTMKGIDTWRVEAEGEMTAQLRDLNLEVPVSYAGQFQAPDRLEGTVAMKFIGVTLKKDMVLLGSTMEVVTQESGEGEATVAPAGMFSLLDFVGFEPAAIRDLALTGEETLDGKPAYHLRGNLLAEPMEVAQEGTELQLEGEVQFEVWIGVDDNLPHLGTVQGSLTASGSVPGTLTVASTATFSEFGQPVTSEAAERPMTMAGGERCGAAGQGFVSHNDEAQAVRFCYPSDWVVDELVDPCACLVVSPDGVVPGTHIPDRMVLVYPPESIAKIDHSAAGLAEVGGRTTICFFQLVRNALFQGDAASLAGLEQGVINMLASGIWRKEPIVAFVNGIEYDGTKALASGYLTNEEAHRTTVESIIASIAAGATAEP
ncbi:MAG: LppX_LprAFG lipoprotein [Anaerolineae bacterium]